MNGDGSANLPRALGGRTSNDTLALTPRTEFASARALTFDFPGLEIGVAEYEEGPTGCAVFHFPAGAACAVDLRGGSIGHVGDYGWVHALCFAGGSLMGLEAAAGVAAELFARGGFNTDFTAFPLVNGAIVYDFGQRNTSIYPDKELGRAALRAAVPGRFPLGAHGAGRAVWVGNAPGVLGERAGQGGAFGRLHGARVAVFTVVNAIGAIVDRRGEVVRGRFDPATGRRQPVAEMVGPGTFPLGNTTLTLVATDLRLDRRSLEQVGRQVHSSMARAIQPFHTLNDGDALYTVSTNAVVDNTIDPLALGVVASELAWDAVLASLTGVPPRLPAAR